MSAFELWREANAEKLNEEHPGMSEEDATEQFRQLPRDERQVRILITVKFLNLPTLKLCCNLPKIQTKRLNLRVFCQKDANGIANSEDPDQTAPLGAV